MCLLIESLAKAGWQVDLVVDTTHNDEFPESSLAGSLHRQLHFNDRSWWQAGSLGIARNLWRICKQPLATDRAWFKRIAAKKYDCIVGVDPVGIATAAQLNADAKVPLVYVSFELLLADEAEGFEERQLKAAERQASQACDLIWIQDSDRARVLADDNDIHADKFCFVPVAPAGPLPARTDDLRQQLGIPAKQTIVLFQGTIAGWSGRDEWESLLSCWDDTVALVAHSRRKIGARHRKFLDRLASQYPVYISDHPVPSAELPGLIASADVGLVSYFPNPDDWHTFGNLDPLGLASGKLSSFLMCGVPVLVNHRTSLGTLVEKHKLGATYRSTESSMDCLKAIMADWEQYSAFARKFYDSDLDPTGPINDFIARLDQL